MKHQNRLHAHRTAAQKGIEKWLAVWTAMHPGETLYGGKGASVALNARQLLREMETAEEKEARRAEAERLNAIPTLAEEDTE